MSKLWDQRIAYAAELAHAIMLCSRINNELAARMANANESYNVSWASVGSAKSYREKLQKLSDEIFGEGEFAEK